MKKPTKEFIASSIVIIVVILVAIVSLTCWQAMIAPYSPPVNVKGTLTQLESETILMEMRLEAEGLVSWVELAEAYPSLLISGNWRAELQKRFAAIEYGFEQLEGLNYAPDLVVGDKFTYEEARGLILEGMDGQKPELAAAGKELIKGIGLWDPK